MGTDRMIFLQFLRKTLLPLPGVTEKFVFDTPAFYVNDKIFTRIHEDGVNLVIGTVERDKWMQAKPNVYHITPHYLNYKYMLVRIDEAEPDDLTELLITAWRNRATKKLIKQYYENVG